MRSTLQHVADLSLLAAVASLSLVSGMVLGFIAALAILSIG